MVDSGSRGLSIVVYEVCYMVIIRLLVVIPHLHRHSTEDRLYISIILNMLDL